MQNNNENTGLGIGDISKLLGVADHTIRYWEKEFSKHLSPTRTKGRQRRYGEDDIKMLKKIKDLLKVDGYSIKGAKRILDSEEILNTMNQNTPKGQPISADAQTLAMQIAELVSSHLSESTQAA